jgi:DNA-binding MarR family transcriptional regulator
MSLTTTTKLRRFLSASREHLGSEATVQKLQVLCEIMLQPGIDQQTLLQRVDQTRSAVSKNIADWSSITSLKKPGPGFVESRINPMNRVIRELYPTDAGKAAWSKVMEALK